VKDCLCIIYQYLSIGYQRFHVKFFY